ncbi:MAG TPA: FAD-dependent oxidoreductase [Pseudonocardia sp.]|jgi:monoamine oxidase
MAPEGRTRREFLHRVGRAGGAGVLLATMGALDLAVTSSSVLQPYHPPRLSDFSLSGKSATRVAILGAGVAGLACAYELGKAGHDCVVLEAQDRVGGRNFTVRGGTRHTDLHGTTQTAAFGPGRYFNTGPGRIAQWMVTLDYCRELGVPLEVFINVNADAYFFQEGMEPGHPIRRRAIKADSFGYISELLAKATDQGALDQRLNQDDKEALLKFLRHFGSVGKHAAKKDGPRNWDYTGGPQRGYSTWPGAAGTPGVLAGPPLSLSTVFGYEIGDDISFETDFEQSMVMLQPVGGMDAIPLALAKAVGADRIKLSSRVTSITNKADGVSIAYKDANGTPQQLDTDFCIATLPPNVLAKLPHNLGPDVQRGLTTFRPVPVGKIGLEYNRRWWESDHRIYGGITETDMDIGEIWYPSSGFHSSGGILVGYYNTDDDAETYAGLSLAERLERALAAGQKIHGPEYRTELANSFSIAWSRAPYIEAGWQEIPGGPDAPVFAPLVRGTGRVYFAGDWLSHEVAWQHGSFMSARKTVSALHARSLAP